MPGRSGKAQARDAKRRKLHMEFARITGRGFDEDWDPTKDHYGSFVKDQIANFQRLAKEDPQQLQDYYNMKRKDVLDAHAAGKNLIYYVKRDNGTYTHRDQTDNGEINGAYGTAYDQAGNESGVDSLRNNLINQARERVVLGLATREDYTDLYAFDHYTEPDNSVLGKLTSAFNSLFDNDFFDGFRFGFGSVLQFGAPIFDYVPGAEGVSEFLDEGGKFVQGDIDSLDTIRANQDRRNGVDLERDAGIGRQQVFDPDAAIAFDRLEQQKEREKEYQYQFSGERLEEYNRQAREEYLRSQGINEQQYDERALPKDQYEKKYGINQPVESPNEIQAEDGANDEDYPILPEGEEFKQAPVSGEEFSGLTPEAVAAGATEPNNSRLEAGIRELNRKVDDLTNSVNGVISRAKERKAKQGGGLKVGGGGESQQHQDRARARVLEGMIRDLEGKHDMQSEFLRRRFESLLRHLTGAAPGGPRVPRERRGPPGGPSINGGGVGPNNPRETPRDQPHTQFHDELAQERFAFIDRQIQRERAQLRQAEERKDQQEIRERTERIGHLQALLRRIYQGQQEHRGGPDRDHLGNGQYGSGLITGGAGSGKRKRRGTRERPRDKPLSPADRLRLEELEDELAEIEFGNGDPAREPIILDEIRRINGRELEELNREYDDYVGGGLKGSGVSPHERNNPRTGRNEPRTVAEIERIRESIAVWQDQIDRLRRGGPSAGNPRAVQRYIQAYQNNIQRLQDQLRYHSGGGSIKSKRGAWRG